MGPFAALERLIERLIERPSARLFRTRVQPLQLQRRLERALETARRPEGDRTVVPNRYAIRLHPDDMRTLAPSAEALAGELADAALSFARAHRYFLADRPRVALGANRGVPKGDIVVEARFEAADPGPDAARPHGDGAGEARGGPAADATAVFAIPSRITVAMLRELRPDGRQREVAIDGRLVTVGRAPDNDVVLDDRRASRHHARLHVRRDSLILTDLASRNGTRVNGVAVTEVVLGTGDRIQIGATILLVEAAPGDDAIASA
jgi:hypothetical protein